MYDPFKFFDPGPLPSPGELMTENRRLSMNWLAKVPRSAQKTDKTTPTSRVRFQQKDYCIDGTGLSKSVWDDACASSKSKLDEIAKGEGDAEILFKSIRVLGGGSNIQGCVPRSQFFQIRVYAKHHTHPTPPPGYRYFDASESKRQRVLNFQLAVERARSSLAQLARFSVAAEDGDGMAACAHGTIDFEGNTNQAP